MKAFRVYSLWIVSAFIAGCMPAASPLDSFKALTDKKAEEVKEMCPSLPIRNLSVDVTKTDSLASPYVGVVTFSTLNRVFNPKGYVADSDATMKLRYALQDGKWVFKSCEMAQSNWRVVKDTSDKFGAEVVAALNKKTHAPDAIDSEELFDGVLKDLNAKLERTR